MRCDFKAENHGVLRQCLLEGAHPGTDHVLPGSAGTFRVPNEVAPSVTNERLQDIGWQATEVHDLQLQLRANAAVLGKREGGRPLARLLDRAADLARDVERHARLR